MATKATGARSVAHAFHALWWHLGPYGRQDVHLHSCLDHERCGIVLVGEGRDCKGRDGGQRHVRKRLAISATGWQNKHMEGTSLYDGKPLGGDSGA